MALRGHRDGENQIALRGWRSSGYSPRREAPARDDGITPMPLWRQRAPQRSRPVCSCYCGVPRARRSVNALRPLYADGAPGKDAAVCVFLLSRSTGMLQRRAVLSACVAGAGAHCAAQRIGRIGGDL
jgi:hypothetical protein